MVLQYEVFIVYRPTKQKLQQAEWPTKYIDYRRICAKLTNYELIWLLLVSSTFAQMHSEVGHFFCKFDQKCSAVDQMHAHLAKRCAFGQIPQVSSTGQMRCAFGQMRTLVKCALQ